MTPLERAARAAFAADYPQHVDADLEIDEAGMVMYEKRHLWYLDAARAILQAIREPSEAMVKAGNRSRPYNLAGWCEGTIHPVVQRAWPAMIDALLEETP